MKTALYARTSGATKAGDDISIETQINQLQDYCKQHRHVVVAVYQDEGHLGRDSDRPGFKKMMDDITNHKLSLDAILVLTDSRLFRNAVDAGLWKRNLRKLGVRVIATAENMDDEDSPIADLVRTILAAFVQNEQRMMDLHNERRDRIPAPQPVTTDDDDCSVVR